MELVRMKLADLRPNPANLRREFEGIEELADRLDLTPGAPGEPMVPLIAVRDANVARLVDGERRFRAMKLRGEVDECWVALCDDMSDAEVALAMLAANDREQLTEDEFSRGLQETMLLGVPEETIDRLARKKGTGRALRRAIDANGGKAAQLTIDHALAAIEVLDAGGTDEDYKSVIDDDFNYAYSKSRIIRGIESERKAAELEEAIAEVVEAHGLVVADKKPKGAMLRSSIYGLDADKVRAEGPTWAASRATLVRPKDGYSYWELYDEPKEMSEAEQQVADSKNKLRRTRTAGEKRRAEWLHGKLSQGGGGMSGLNATEFFLSGWFDENRSYAHRDFLKRAGFDPEDDAAALPMSSNAWMCASEWCNVDHIGNDECDMLAVAGAVNSSYYAAPIERHVAVMRALERDGYEPDEDERAFTALCEQRLAELHEGEK